MTHSHGDEDSNKDSISLFGAVGMGTGVMIGAGIFALTGQIAQLAGPYFALSFVLGAIITSFSAYSYIKMSDAWPSSGGIAMILQKAYGPGAIAAAASLLMALSMVISESLVARTFATYVLRPFDISGGPLVPILAVGVILFAFLVNISGNRSIGLLSIIMAVIKIGGIALFGIVALWSGGFSLPEASDNVSGFSTTGFVASVALSILAFKGFTTITNSGGEITDPHRNVGRTIMISIAICIMIYLLVALAVGSNLTIDEIVESKDYSLAEAAEPAFGRAGFYFTVVLAVVATASGVLASVFAVSRMLAMLTKMKMIPHSHFGMSGPIRSHTLVYTVVLASTLAVFFDLSRIASLGAFFYLIMDMLVHWGVFRHLRKEIGASGAILLCALGFDAIVLVAFATMKLRSDPMIVLYAVIAITAVFAYERTYLSHWTVPQDDGGD
ncbi:APC family permease [Litoreibacter arenae]|uniref:Amino acid permease n=1 Tax=Litoreibacter arenae DSM 19593 TaxID=1123360 RepID=S9QDC4_9RHOB|nr:APC family permease [Litoreibacter arenae]EPX77568.1 Amino acid permease [Litoreibacter arenae DSM 19593]